MDKIEPTPAPVAPALQRRRSFFYQNAQRPIWSMRWFHWALGISVVLMICSYILPTLVRVLALAEPILVPILVGLALAYIFNPLVNFAEKKLRLPRPVTTVAIMVFFGLLLTIVIVWVIPTAASQGSELMAKLPEQLDTLAKKMGDDGFLGFLKLRDTKEIQHWLHDMADKIRAGDLSITPFIGGAGRALGAGWALVSGVLGFVMYAIIFTIVTSACFFFFSWRFSAIIAWPQPFIPVEYQGTVVRLGTLCDRAVSAFIRGRLIQATVFGTVLTIGWGFCGVKYFILLGLIGGMLALLPYLAGISLILVLGVVGFQSLAKDATPLTQWDFIWPAGVYLLAQGLDGFVVEPCVQGKATGLSPLAVLLAVLIGGSVAGVLGVILAIPTAACIMIIWREAALPRFKELAGGN